MTERRRFFPARPVQQVPGQTVGLQGRLRPVAAPAPAVQAEGGDVGDVVCTGWLVPWLCAAPPDDLLVSTLPDGNTEIHGDPRVYDVGEVNYGALLGSVWSGSPGALDTLGRARPIPSEAFACIELDVETTFNLPFPGRHFMALVPGGSWVVEWDLASVDPAQSVSGHRADVVDGTLFVSLQDTDTSVTVVETLTATAFDGATQIAELIFRAHRFAE